MVAKVTTFSRRGAVDKEALTKVELALPLRRRRKFIKVEAVAELKAGGRGPPRRGGEMHDEARKRRR